MNLKIPTHIIERTNSLLEKYNVIDNKHPVLVAFSGGKDSLLTNLILKESGFKTLAIHINMGFHDSKNHTKYLIEIAKNYNFELEVFDVSSPTMLSTLPEDLRKKVSERLNILFKNSKHENDSYTPCTHCYNAKFLVLHYLANLYNIEHIALGHHGTDAVVSLIKSALMYIDRWDNSNEVFKRSNFEQLIYKLTNVKNLKASIVLRITELVEQNCASTDEPPVKTGNMLKIIRPLFNIFEPEIVNIYSNTLITFKNDGCEFGVKPKPTPREMIHSKLPKLEFVKYFHKIIESNLAQDGTVRFDARNNRDQLLGNRYKQTPLGEIKL